MLALLRLLFPDMAYLISDLRSLRIQSPAPGLQNNPVPDPAIAVLASRCIPQRRIDQLLDLWPTGKVRKAIA